MCVCAWVCVCVCVCVYILPIEILKFDWLRQILYAVISNMPIPCDLLTEYCFSQPFQCALTWNLNIMMSYSTERLCKEMDSECLHILELKNMLMSLLNDHLQDKFIM